MSLNSDQQLECSSSNCSILAHTQIAVQSTPNTGSEPGHQATNPLSLAKMAQATATAMDSRPASAVFAAGDSVVPSSREQPPVPAVSVERLDRCPSTPPEINVTSSMPMLDNMVTLMPPPSSSRQTTAVGRPPALDRNSSFGGPAGVASSVDNNGGDPDMPRPVVAAEVIPHPIVNDYVDQHRRKGVLIPLKTTLELRQDHTLTRAYITRAPIKAANNIVRLVVSASKHVLSLTL